MISFSIRTMTGLLAFIISSVQVWSQMPIQAESGLLEHATPSNIGEDGQRSIAAYFREYASEAQPPDNALLSAFDHTLPSIEVARMTEADVNEASGLPPLFSPDLEPEEARRDAAHSYHVPQQLTEKTNQNPGRSLDVEWIIARGITRGEISENSVSGIRARIFKDVQHDIGSSGTEFVFLYLGQNFGDEESGYDGSEGIFSLEANTVLSLADVQRFIAGVRFVQMDVDAEYFDLSGNRFDFSAKSRLLGFQLGFLEDFQLFERLWFDIGLRSGVYGSWQDGNTTGSIQDLSLVIFSEANAAFRYRLNDRFLAHASMFAINYNDATVIGTTLAGVGFGLVRTF